MTDIYQDGTYLANNDGWHVADSPWKATQIKRAIESNGVEFDSVAEVGCGAGEVLAQLATFYPNKSFVGYELAPQAFSMCSERRQEHLQFHCASLLDAQTRFDLLLCIDVFEHVDDYFGFLRGLKSKATHAIFHIPLDISAQSVLRGGKLLRERRRVGHIHMFTRDTALATLEDCGYKIVDSFYTAGSIDLPNLSWKARLMKLPRQILFAMAPDWTVRLLGGYSLLVLAKVG
jgi:cyclopropane fatty-acyl-phospholipid synthase-like methyltransferase